MKKLLYILLVTIPACLIGITSYAHCPHPYSYKIHCIISKGDNDNHGNGVQIIAPVDVETVYHVAAPECKINDDKIMSNGKFDPYKLETYCLKQDSTKTFIGLYSADGNLIWFFGWHSGTGNKICWKRDSMGKWQEGNPGVNACGNGGGPTV